MKQSSKWLSAHIFYTKPYERILTEAIYPLITNLKHQNALEQYFYILYSEKGPHIRLRIKADKRTLESTVKPALETTISSYMSKNPSIRTNNSHSDWFPNNSIQYIPYEPEHTRYGGKHAIDLAERHFNNSSDLVFSALQEYKNITYTEKLNLALQIQLTYAAGLVQSSHTKSFFRFLIDHRLNRQDNLRKQLEAHWQKQKHIKIQIQNVWSALFNQDSAISPWMKSWIQTLRTLKSDMESNLTSSLIEQSSCFFVENYQGESKDTLTLWHIYESYIHMTNNRLGIQTADEPMLTYIIHRALKDIT